MINRDLVEKLLVEFYRAENLLRIDVSDASHYQHQPAVIIQGWNALVRDKHQGVLLADEVGLGKTYEALGIIYLYLLHMGGGSEEFGARVLFVLPPKLITKWDGELKTFANLIQPSENVLDGTLAKFSAGLRDALRRAYQLKADDILRHKGEQPHTVEPGFFFISENTLIDVINTWAANNSKRHKYQVAINWDFVCFDEAHRFARWNHGSGSKRGEAASILCEAVCDKGGKIALCSATPFQLDTTELVNLLGLIVSNATKRERIGDKIESFNAIIRQIQEHAKVSQLDGAFDHLRAMALQAKNELEELLQPIMFRSLRSMIGDEKGREYEDVRVPPGHDFPWFYWDIRKWLLEIASNQSMRTFAPTSLHMAISSPQAASEHLHKWRKKHRTRKPELTKIYGKLIEAVQKEQMNPKLNDLRMLIQSRIQSAAQGGIDKVEDLARHKCVIFVSHPATIIALMGRGNDHVGDGVRVGDSFRDKAIEHLEKHHIKPEMFSKAISTAVEKTFHSLLAEFNYEERGKISIWETAYDSQIDNLFGHLRGVKYGYRDDLSNVKATSDQVSLGKMLLRNLKKKVLEPLNMFQFMNRLLELGLVSENMWQGPLSDMAAQITRKRLEKQLNQIKKDYFGNNGNPQQHREWLRFQLSKSAYGFSPRKVVEALKGDVDFATRQQIIDAFNHDLYPLILICSSVGDEGIDLQKRCNTVVHYDLEWNPAKVEQREGRVDRLGRDKRQAAQVSTYVLSGTYDERILNRCRSRKVWMDLYLCRSWVEEGKKTEEETVDGKSNSAIPERFIHMLDEFRLDLKPKTFLQTRNR